MKMQIVTCPRCGTYLFDDTAECHGCGHIISEHTGERLKSRLLPTDNAVQDDMQACPNCGETCRTGLVRCWNCSSFLRSDIEETYRKMRESGHRTIEHVELPILEASMVTEEDSLKRRIVTPDSFLESRVYATEDFSDGDDFELSSEAQLSEEDDDSFDLSESLQLASPLEDDSDLNAQEVFRLQDPIDESPSSEEIPRLLDSAPEDEPSIPADTIETPVINESVDPPVRAATAEIPPVAVEDPPEPAEDELLRIAADEEQDIQRVRKTMRSKDSFVIYCPQGCRIRVKERHRGKTGKCPRCQCEFVVPRKPAAKKSDAQSDAVAEPVVASKYVKWLSNIRLHVVDPLKLRIKADSLLNECQSVDLGFSVEDLLMPTLITGKFVAMNPKKVHPLRQAMIEHFLKGGTYETLVVPAKKIYPKEILAQMNVAQPTPPGTESLFANIPVFGTNRIAVKIPRLPEDAHAMYLSFSLSEFRAFAEGLQTVLGIEGLGKNTEIPMTDEYKTHKCHLSQAPVLELAKVNYFEKDPGFKLEISGWKCAACGIVISEAARAESKLGGANGKGIAKAKCPKCTLKYGSLPMYQLEGAGSPKPAEETATAPA